MPHVMTSAKTTKSATQTPPDSNFVFCTVIHRLPLGATCSSGPPGRNTFFEGVRGRTTAEALDLAALRFAAIRQRCPQL